MDQQKVVGVVGLGAMGLGMAASLARAGFRTLAFDLSPERRALAEAAGCEAAETPQAVFAAADWIVFSLPTAQIVAAVVADCAAEIAGRERVVIVDTSTSEPGVTRALAAELAAQGHGFVDAPVSGGPAGAAQGALTMMLGGSDADLDEVAPVIAALSAKAVRVGGSGAGNVAKLVNNLLCAANMALLAEGLRLAEAGGISAEAALEVLNGASGGSTVSKVHIPTWVSTGAFDSGFTMALMRKDVRLARALAAETGQALPLAEAAAQLWAEAPFADAEDFTRMGDYRAR